MNRRRRLFFALWPGESVRQQIKLAAYPRLKPETTPSQNWHMTLVFLGATLPEQQDSLERAADKIKAEPFSVSLDITGQFDSARVAWLGCQHPDWRLLSLQKNLESALRKSCPAHPAFEAETGSYCPHVTLYRHIRKSYPAREFEPIHWRVNSFCLIESRRAEQPVYQVLNSWRLCH